MKGFQNQQRKRSRKKSTPDMQLQLVSMDNISENSEAEKEQERLKEERKRMIEEKKMERKHKEQRRIRKLELDPIRSFFNNEYLTLKEKDLIFEAIIQEIEEYKNSQYELKSDDNDLGSFCITNCKKCWELYGTIRKRVEEKGECESMSWLNFFNTVEKFGFKCGEGCLLGKLDDNKQEAYLKKIKSRNDRLKHKNGLHIGYRVALEQKKNLMKQLDDSVQIYKETITVLIFKKKNLQWVINIIQISIIIVSTFITFFEALKSEFKSNITDFGETVVPIVCSSYIGLILAIARFFKFDVKNEQIIKLVEKYSFIINKLRQKRNTYGDFDFKIHNLNEWRNTMNVLEKDSIDDIIMKANEERDILLNPQEYVHYKKKYSKNRLKELTERYNFTELTDIIKNSKKMDKKEKGMAQRMVKKRSFCKYYFCCLWMCMDREYVDYNKTLIDNRINFIKYIDDKESEKAWMEAYYEGKPYEIQTPFENLGTALGKIERAYEDLVMRRQKNGATQTPPSRVCSIHEKPEKNKGLQNGKKKEEKEGENVKIDIEEKNTPGSIL